MNFLKSWLPLRFGKFLDFLVPLAGNMQPVGLESEQSVPTLEMVDVNNENSKGEFSTFPCRPFFHTLCRGFTNLTSTRARKAPVWALFLWLFSQAVWVIEGFKAYRSPCQIVQRLLQVWGKSMPLEQMGSWGCSAVLKRYCWYRWRYLLSDQPIWV